MKVFNPKLNDVEVKEQY